MKKRLLIGIGLVIVLGIAAVCLEPTKTLLGHLRGEQFFQGRPTTYWQKSLTSDDPAAQERARKALRDGGAQAGGRGRSARSVAACAGADGNRILQLRGRRAAK